MRSKADRPAQPTMRTNRVKPRRPKIFGVVNHLFIEVLSESDVMVDVEADFLQIQIHSGHEVAKGLVVYYALIDCLADGDHSWGSCWC